jgi:hypothetical protein
MSSLDELVPRYYANKETEKILKKEIDDDNKEIKSIMLNSNSENENVGEYKVTCKTIVTEDFDKDLLVAKLKSLWEQTPGSEGIVCPWLDFVPVVNDEALENAIYDGQINPDDLKSCKVSKSQVRLTVSKPKKKEE